MKNFKLWAIAFLTVVPFSFQASNKELALAVGQRQRTVEYDFLVDDFSTKFGDQASLTLLAKEQLGLKASGEIDYSKFPKKAARDVLFDKLFNMCDCRTIQSCSMIALTVLLSAPAHQAWNQSCAAGVCDYRYLSILVGSVGLSLVAHYDNYINWTDRADLKNLSKRFEQED